MFQKYKSVINKYKILIPLVVSNYLFRNKGFVPDKKFIILSRSRTGSTMLINHLKKIPDSYIQSEMLRRKFLIPFWERIPNLIFGNHFKKYRIAGFKSFYYHPIDDWDSNNFIYNYILSNPEIKVIHWYREDLFAVLISRAIAVETGKWAKTKTGSKLNIFSVDENEFICDMEKTIFQFYTVKKMFSNRENYFEISFEDVVERNKLDKLFSFLEIENSAIKYSSKSHQKSIENYRFVSNIEQLKNIYVNRIEEWSKVTNRA